MNEFRKLPTTILGTVGESYIPEFSQHFKLKTFIPALDEAYPIDSLFLCEEGLFGLEIKTKPSRTWHPDTGFDKADLDVYNNLIECGDVKDVVIMFVDSLTRRIYFQYLSILNDYKKVEGQYVYFPLDKLRTYRELGSDEVDKLKRLCKGNYSK